jgi:hypothetical protein
VTCFCCSFVTASSTPTSYAAQRIEGERCLRTNAGDLGSVLTTARHCFLTTLLSDFVHVYIDYISTYTSSLLSLLRLRPSLHQLHLHRSVTPSSTPTSYAARRIEGELCLRTNDVDLGSVLTTVRHCFLYSAL